MGGWSRRADAVVAGLRPSQGVRARLRTSLAVAAPEDHQAPVDDRSDVALARDGWRARRAVAPFPAHRERVEAVHGHVSAGGCTSTPQIQIRSNGHEAMALAPGRGGAASPRL